MFDGEGFKALADGFVLLWLMLLGVGREARGDPGGGRAVTASGPHRRLQHLHGITPLAGRDVHLVQGRAWIGHGVVLSVSGVLPWGLRRPSFSFAFLVIIISQVMEGRRGQGTHLLLATAVFSSLFDGCNKIRSREHGEQAVPIG